jgi:hypothetical protein
MTVVAGSNGLFVMVWGPPDGLKFQPLGRYNALGGEAFPGLE